MEDSQIIECFFARDESAIAEMGKKYGKYCHYIAYRILENDEDAEEVVNDTYLKAWNSIPPAHPAQLKPYLGAISRNLALDAYDMRHAQRRGGELGGIIDELSECVPGGDGAELMDSLALRDALTRFVSSLPERERKLFVRRYWYAASVAELTAELGIKPSHVTVLLSRMRKKLKRALEEEGIEI